MKTKKIGIPGWMTAGVFGVPSDYISYIAKFGTPIIITPEMVNNPPEVDYLYLPGGADILIENQTPNYNNSNPNLMLEFFDRNILPTYIQRNTPTLAVCRAAQRIWTMFGGTLNQHNPYHKQSAYKEDQAHYLVFTEEYAKLNNYIEKVTSRHHQTMVDDDNNLEQQQSLEVIAYGTDMNTKKYNHTHALQDVVEIYKVANHNIIGVQFHPESQVDNLIPKLITTNNNFIYAVNQENALRA